jgi:hypothetical protein
MLCTSFNPVKSARYEFDEETKATLGQDINTDAMHLRKRGRGFAKAEEGGQGGVLHSEGNYPMTSSGGSGEDK